MFGLEIDQKTIKISNRTRILGLLFKKGETTKQEISNYLKLSIPTVTTNINNLIAEGLVEEAGIAESTGGRKPVIIRFKPNSRYAFGIDISPTKITVALTNLFSEILVERQVVIENDLMSFEDIIRESHVIVEDIINSKMLDKNKVLGVGFSLPGIVDEENLILENAPNLKVKNFDLKPFRKLFNIPIIIENEANAAAIGEMTFGAAKNKSNFVYLSITEGVGTGIIIQKHIYKSMNKRAGEFGHMRITDEDLKCNCGRTGCWELFTSEKALIRNFNQNSKERITSIKEFFMHFENDSIIAKKVLNEYLFRLAIGIQNITLALAPEHVIIGGAISEYHKLYKDILMSNIEKESSIYDMNEINIDYSRLKGKASLHGACILAMQDLYTISRTTI